MRDARRLGRHHQRPIGGVADVLDQAAEEQGDKYRGDRVAGPGDGAR